MKKQLFLLSVLFLYFGHSFCVTDLSLTSRVQGAILASAVGDALGRVPEVYWIRGDKQKLEKDFPKPIRHFGDFRKSDFENDGTAIWTDDTQMAWLVADALLEHKDYAQQQKFTCLNSIMWDIAKHFADWVIDSDGGLSHKRAPGVGCKRASKRLRNIFISVKPYIRFYFGSYRFPAGSDVFNVYDSMSRYNYAVDYDHDNFKIVKQTVCEWARGEGGELKPFSEGGCGSVMRAYPFGLCFMNDMEYATKLAELHSCLTHRAPMSHAACAAMAAGMVRAMNGSSSEDILTEMVKYAKDVDADTAKIMEDAISKAKANPSEKEIREYLEKLEGKLANQAIAATVFVFACEHKDLLRALRLSINFYGDSDSVGAMVGALLGAHLGSDVLFDNDNFDNYLKPLEDREGLMKLSGRVVEFIEQTRPVSA